jgi:hypothetical protein
MSRAATSGEWDAVAIWARVMTDFWYGATNILAKTHLKLMRTPKKAFTE